MMETSIEDIHQALACSEQDFEALRQIKRIWDRVDKLKRAAQSGSTVQLKAYKDFLQKCLPQARTMQTIEEIDDLVRMGAEFTFYYDKLCNELNIVQFESGRWPQPHQEWVERHLPQVWQGYVGAFARWCNTPTRQSYEELKISAKDMLQAYVAANTRD